MSQQLGIWVAFILNLPNLELFVQLYEAEGDSTTFTPDASSYYTVTNTDYSWAYRERGDLVIYTFNEGHDAQVGDESKSGQLLTLTIGKPSATSWVAGSLTINSATALISKGAARKISVALKASNQFSIELWFTPADLVVHQAHPHHL